VDPDELLERFGGVAAIIGAIVGVVIGLVTGFHDHGVGGALLYGLGGSILGGFLGAIVLILAGYALAWGVILATLYVLYFIFSHLWDLGKP